MSIQGALASLVDPSYVTVFHSGSKALDALTHSSERTSRGKRISPILVILDFHLPGMGAPEVIVALRASRPMSLVPIVVLSDSCEMQDIKASYESGANGFVCKPVDFEKFQERVKLIGQYWLEVNHCPS